CRHVCQYVTLAVVAASGCGALGCFVFLSVRHSQSSTLFPYTTLFRSGVAASPSQAQRSGMRSGVATSASPARSRGATTLYVARAADARFVSLHSPACRTRERAKGKRPPKGGRLGRPWPPLSFTSPSLNEVPCVRRRVSREATVRPKRRRVYGLGERASEGRTSRTRRHVHSRTQYLEM